MHLLLPIRPCRLLWFVYPLCAPQRSTEITYNIETGRIERPRDMSHVYAVVIVASDGAAVVWFFFFVVRLQKVQKQLLPLVFLFSLVRLKVYKDEAMFVRKYSKPSTCDLSVFAFEYSQVQYHASSTLFAHLFRR
jgi:hypothetical protein